MDPFKAIQYVTSGFTLVAFIAAIGGWVYRYRLKSRKEMIELAKPESRADLVQRTLNEFFPVDTAGLTNEQKYDLVIRQIDARSKRFRLTVSLSVTAMIALLSVISVTYLSRSHITPVDNTTRPQIVADKTPVGSDDSQNIYLVKIDGDGAAFPVGKYQNFLVKAVNSHGNPVAGVKIAWSTPVGGDKAYVNVTANDGTASATNLYTFPSAGPYEEVAAIVPDDTQVGFTSTSALKDTKSAVKFEYSQGVETVCGNGHYHEPSNAATWTCTHVGNAVELHRSDNSCSASLSPLNGQWSGTLQCTNGASYQLTATPTSDWSEIDSSLSWFKLNE